MSEYEKQAEEFLKNSGTKIEVRKRCVIKGFPNSKNDTFPHVKYLVMLSRDNKTYDFPFYDSTYNYQNNLRPTKYSILGCVEKYEPPSDVWDFAREFGYEIHSREDYDRISKIQNDCKEQYFNLLDLFGETWMDELRKIV